MNMLYFFPRALGFGFRAAWCMSMPWHTWRHVRWVSEVSEKLRCEHCGQEWSTNHDMRSTLPWDCVRELYDRRETKRFGRPIVD